jgi:hypothetical protein
VASEESWGRVGRLLESAVMSVNYMCNWVCVGLVCMSGEERSNEVSTREGRCMRK